MCRICLNLAIIITTSAVTSIDILYKISKILCFCFQVSLAVRHQIEGK